MAARMDAANTPDTVRYVMVGVRSAGEGADVIAKVDAGAALVYALYHSDAEFMRNLPDPVTQAYMKACRAYRVGKS